MTARIGGIKDNLDQRNAEFEQAPLRQGVFLNSIPKGGTHLIRNILRMFVPVRQHYHRDLIQLPTLAVHAAALSAGAPMLSSGHMLFTDESAAALSPMRHILLVRDPYDWVLARLRFFLSDEFQQANLMHLKSGLFAVPELLNMMILGIYQKAPSLQDIYTHNAAAWLGTNVQVYRYEDLVEAVADLTSKRSEALFMKLFADAGIEPPANWRERVEIGADRRQSRTARENLNLAAGLKVPDVLPDVQKRLVDFHAPGLRQVLGYA